MPDDLSAVRQLLTDLTKIRVELDRVIERATHDLSNRSSGSQSESGQRSVSDTASLEVATGCSPVANGLQVIDYDKFLRDECRTDREIDVNLELFEKHNLTGCFVHVERLDVDSVMARYSAAGKGTSEVKRDGSVVRSPDDRQAEQLLRMGVSTATGECDSSKMAAENDGADSSRRARRTDKCPSDCEYILVDDLIDEQMGNANEEESEDSGRFFKEMQAREELDDLIRSVIPADEEQLSEQDDLQFLAGPERAPKRKRSRMQVDSGDVRMVEPLMTVSIEQGSGIRQIPGIHHNSLQGTLQDPIVLSSEDSESERETGKRVFNTKKPEDTNPFSKRLRHRIFSSSGSSGDEALGKPHAKAPQFDDCLPPTDKDVSSVKRIVLDYDKDTKKCLVDIHPNFMVYLRDHQVDGIRFMWDCCFESIEKIRTEPGRGCILSHCMGLGKTLQVIVFLNSIMRYPDVTNVRRALILVPKNTIKNWMAEFYKWQLCLDQAKDKVQAFELTDIRVNARLRFIQQWLSRERMAALIIGYEQFRHLVASKNQSKYNTEVITNLLNPGPDILVCDEGHVLKNRRTSLFKCVSRIATKRKVILSGTPLQNKLGEYYCMLSLVSPSLLENYPLFKARFVVPIEQGMLADSTEHDVKVMKKRVHVLHNLLDEVVQRKDYKFLASILPPKYEYVLSVRPSKLQQDMYRYYSSTCMLDNQKQSARLFAAIKSLTRILAHPWLCKMRADQDTPNSDGSDTTDESIVWSDSSSEQENESRLMGSRHRDHRDQEGVNQPCEPALKDWWMSFVTDTDEFRSELSGKIVILLDIIDHCFMNEEKMVIFSQSILALNYIERLLGHRRRSAIGSYPVDHSDINGFHKDCWIPDLDYCRIDGYVNCKNRDRLIKMFNEASNPRLRLFIISTKAGGIGINLCAANRVVIFDVSWNPANDIQSIFRLYRIGQTKSVYIYRLVGQGSIEEKIYQRQVNKEGLTLRVCDEHHLERHFTSSDLSELYAFTPDDWDSSQERDTPVLPKDRLLADLLKAYPQWIVKYHEHDSLLQKEVDLTEEERQAAWREYECEKMMSDQQVANTQPLCPPYPIPLTDSELVCSTRGYASLGETVRHPLVRPFQSPRFRHTARPSLMLTRGRNFSFAPTQQLAIAPQLLQPDVFGLTGTQLIPDPTRPFRGNRFHANGYVSPYEPDQNR